MEGWDSDLSQTLGMITPLVALETICRWAFDLEDQPSWIRGSKVDPLEFAETCAENLRLAWKDDLGSDLGRMMEMTPS